jgi:hypothetical protein
MIKLAVKWLMKLLSQKEVQSVLIETAKELAKKTANKTDDEVVSWFEKIWKEQ